MVAYKRIDHIALHVSDLAASIKFYESHSVPSINHYVSIPKWYD